MSLIEIILLSVGVAMDAFAVSVCKGMTSYKKLKTAFACGTWFSCFQTIMPAIGFFIGVLFSDFIEKFDHWIVFLLLLYLGFNMIKESLSKTSKMPLKNDISIKNMFILSLATSIDALAIGITLAIVKANILLVMLFICIITFAFCFLGVIIGNKFGEKNKKLASVFGGLILIGLGLKIVLEHTLFK